MPKECKERFDANFIHYVATFNIRKRKNLLKKLGDQDGRKSIIVLRNDNEVSEFLNSIKTNRA